MPLDTWFQVLCGRVRSVTMQCKCTKFPDVKAKWFFVNLEFPGRLWRASDSAGWRKVAGEKRTSEICYLLNLWTKLFFKGVGCRLLWSWRCRLWRQALFGRGHGLLCSQLDQPECWCRVQIEMSKTISKLLRLWNDVSVWHSGICMQKPIYMLGIINFANVSTTFWGTTRTSTRRFNPPPD